MVRRDDNFVCLWSSVLELVLSCPLFEHFFPKVLLVSEPNRFSVKDQVWGKKDNEFEHPQKDLFIFLKYGSLR